MSRERLVGDVLCALMDRLGADELDLGALPINPLPGKVVVMDARDGRMTVRVMDEKDAREFVSAVAAKKGAELEPGAGQQVQKIEFASNQRVETGAVQFGDDWPGVFIRGDNAAGFALSLDHAAEALREKGFYVEEAGVNGLARLLTSCRV